MHILSFPVMPIMQSDPVGCSAICLQMVVIGDWLSLCCFRATGDRIIMPHHCCVPGCTSNSRDKTLEAISFHSFLKDCALAREWIAKIRRDVGDHFQVNEHMKVCSLHFEADAYCSGSQRQPDDKKLTTVTCQKLKGDAIPKFFWSTPARSRKAPTVPKSLPLRKRRKIDCRPSGSSEALEENVDEASHEEIQ